MRRDQTSKARISSWPSKGLALGRDDDLPLRFGHASFASGLAAMGQRERAVMTAVVPEHVAMAAMQKESPSGCPSGRTT